MVVCGILTPLSKYLLSNMIRNIILPGDSAQIQRGRPHRKMQDVVSWNIPEHKTPPSHSIQGSGLAGETLSGAL